MKKLSEKRKQKLEEKKKSRDIMLALFNEIWKERKHVSEVSGKYLGDEPLTSYFHHILPKSKYPDLALEKSNIILLTFEEHEQVEIDSTRYDEINKRRKILIESL